MFLPERPSYASQREVRSIGPTFELVSESIARQLDVVMEQLQARLLLDAHPDDPGTPKVWKRADRPEMHCGGRMRAREVRHRRGERRDGFVGHVTNELEGQVDLRFGNPADVGRRLT